MGHLVRRPAGRVAFPRELWATSRVNGGLQVADIRSVRSSLCTELRLIDPTGVLCTASAEGGRRC